MDPLRSSATKKKGRTRGENEREEENVVGYPRGDRSGRPKSYERGVAGVVKPSKKKSDEVGKRRRIAFRVSFGAL